MHSQSMLRDSLAVRRIFGTVSSGLVQKSFGVLCSQSSSTPTPPSLYSSGRNFSPGHVNFSRKSRF